MADLTDIQSAQTIKIAGANSSGVEDNYAEVDSNGNLLVKNYSVGPVTPGSVAAGSSLIGGQYNSSLPTLTTTQQAAFQLDSSGRLLISSLPTGSNVIGAVTQSGTWTTGRTWLLSSTGLTPDSILANQNGTWTVAQGTAAALAGRWPVQITDGTNTMPTMDTIARAGFQKITDGTNTATVNANNELRVTQDNTSSVPVEIVYDQTVTVANTNINLWFKGQTYTVPATYKYNIDLITTGASAVTTNLRAARVLQFATFNTGTLTGTASINTWASPGFASQIEAEVTTTTANTAITVITVTYTNQDGTTGKTTTVSIPKQVTAGYKVPIALAAGDYGVRAVTAVSGTPANVGAVSINGLLALVYNGTGVAGQVFYTTPKSPGAWIMRTGETITLDYISTAAVAAERIIRVLGRLEIA